MAKKPKLNYTRTASSPYPAGSAEDRKLSMDAAAKSAQNRKALTQGVKDVVTGRAAWEGAKAVGRWATQNVSRTEERHKRITGYKGK